MLDALFSTVSDRSSRREVLPGAEGADGVEVVDVLDVDVSDVEYVADGFRPLSCGLKRRRVQSF